MNVKNVFLNGNLQEENYMEQPPILLLRGSLLDWYVISTNLYMISNSLLGPSLESLVVLKNLV